MADKTENYGSENEQTTNKAADSGEDNETNLPGDPDLVPSKEIDSEDTQNETTAEAEGENVTAPAENIETDGKTKDERPSEVAYDTIEVTKLYMSLQVFPEYSSETTTMYFLKISKDAGAIPMPRDPKGNIYLLI